MLGPYIFVNVNLSAIRTSLEIVNEPHLGCVVIVLVPVFGFVVFFTLYTLFITYQLAALRSLGHYLTVPGQTLRTNTGLNIPYTGRTIIRSLLVKKNLILDCCDLIVFVMKCILKLVDWLNLS